jgi:hypothetical protein
MSEIPNVDQVRDFVERFSELRLLSTGAEVVNISDPLYNVIGSTGDPIPLGASSWKNLLIEEADIPSDSDCYVTNDTPSGNSHPDFSVGGHMTINSDGSVGADGICYLMPLCYFHNAQDGEAFEHSNTKMLKLTGYMQGELFATFSARLPSPEPFALIYFDDADGQWKHRNISKDQASNVDMKLFGLRQKARQCKHRVLFERAIDNPLLQSVIKSDLPTRAKKR